MTLQQRRKLKLNVVLDGKEEEIRILLQKQVSKASIAKIVGVTRPTIHRFIETRRLEQKITQNKERQRGHL